MNPQPTMKATELYSRAAKYADEMIAELGALNKQYPRAEMTPEEERIFLANCGKDFSINVEGARAAFESSFCRYMASRFDILPEE